MEGKVQNAVDTISDWANKNEFKFSEKKTKAMQFFKESKPAYMPNVTMNGQKIPLTEYVKFLGLHFDGKLSWQYHIHNLASRCAKDHNVMKFLTASQ